LYFVAFKLDYYIANPSEIFAIREGGLAIYGGIIGAIITACIVAKVKKMKFIPILDIGAIGFLIGQGIGRWGNFVNREAYGAMTNPDFIFGMTSPSIAKDVAIEMGVPYSENILVHPCFLYESIWCLLGAVLLFFYIKHRKFDGEIGLLYCLWYGIERTIVEGLRTDSLYIGDTGIRVSQALSFILALTALIALIILYYKIYKNRIKLNNNNYLVLYANTEKSKQELEQSEKQRKDSRNKEKSKNETKKEDRKPL
ncbi:MAG: prolipoprotein diacylglyceryl transferase, partial [Oscillospiraceae bacterium]